jgi:hypothetical protein
MNGITAPDMAGDYRQIIGEMRKHGELTATVFSSRPPQWNHLGVFGQWHPSTARIAAHDHQRHLVE